MSEIAYHVELGPLSDVACVVKYNYQPSERQTASGAGCGENIEITGVAVHGIEFVDRGLEQVLIDDLQDDDLLLGRIHDAEVEARGGR